MRNSMKIIILCLFLGLMLSLQSIAAQGPWLRDQVTSFVHNLLPTTSVQTAYKIIYRVCGISQNDLQREAKNFAIEKHGLREISPEWRALIEEALKDTGISTNIEFLEGDQLLEEEHAMGFHTMPFPFCTSIIALKPLESYTSRESALWTLYHELGHAYHQHTLKSKLLLPLALTILFTLVYQTRKFGGTLPVKFVVPLMAALFVKFYPTFLRQHSIAQEKEADLFACKHLVQHNKAYAVIEHLPNVDESAMRRASGEEQRDYLLEYLFAHKDKISPDMLKNIDALFLKLIDDNKPKFIKELLDLGATFSCEGRLSPLGMAIVWQRFDIVEEFLKRDITLATCNEEEDSLILQALTFDKVTVHKLAEKYKKFGDSPTVQQALSI